MSDEEDDPRSRLSPERHSIQERQLLLSGSTRRSGYHGNTSEEDDAVEESDDVTQKRRCLRNLLCHCLSCLLVMTSYMSLQNLESSLNAQSGLGVAGLSSVYVGLVVSCLLAPLVISYTGYKWTMVLCFLCHCIFAASNFYPAFYTIVPASLLLGLLSGPFWTAQGVFLTTLALQYSDLIETEASVIISRFNGFFFMFFQTSQICGNLVSSLVLYRNAHNESDVISNVTSCGASFCSWDTNGTRDSSAHAPAHSAVTLLVGVYFGCCILGVLIKSFLVDNIKRQQLSGGHDLQEGLGVPKAAATVAMHGEPLMLLLIPLCVYNGLEQGFLFGDFTEAFVGCQLGIGSVGYTMIAFGATNAVSSFLIGQLEKQTGRGFLFTMAACINAGLYIYMLIWRPEVGPEWVFYVIPGLWGVADSIWQTTMCSLVAVVFAESRDPAFATFRLWQSVGLLIAFAYSYQLCMLPKICIALGLLVVAMVAYVAMEMKLRLSSWSQKAYIDLYSPILE